MQPPNWMVKKLAAIDPWLRFEFNRSQGLWRVIRLNGASQRGRKSELPNYFFAHCGSGLYTVKRGYSHVLWIGDRYNNFVQLEAVAASLFEYLHKIDVWEKGQRTGKIIEEREEREAIKAEIEEMGETKQTAKTIWNAVTRPTVDLGARSYR